MVAVLESKLEKITELCARFRVSTLEAFGSAIREDFNPNESDLDFLVEFLPMEPYARVDAYFGLLDELHVEIERIHQLIQVHQFAHFVFLIQFNGFGNRLDHCQFFILIEIHSFNSFNYRTKLQKSPL